MIRRILLASVSILLAQQAHSQSASELQVKSDDNIHKFSVEVANTPDLITLGLMNRDTLAEDAGMLFDFGESRDTRMWMKSTLLPLDMLFINEAGYVMAIARNAVPQSERRIGIGVPVRAVLELNGDTANRLGIQPGDTVIHELFNNTDSLQSSDE